MHILCDGATERDHADYDLLCSNVTVADHRKYGVTHDSWHPTIIADSTLRQKIISYLVQFKLPESHLACLILALWFLSYLRILLKPTYLIPVMNRFELIWTRILPYRNYLSHALRKLTLCIRTRLLDIPIIFLYPPRVYGRSG